MDGFNALCAQHLPSRERHMVGDWTLLMPLSLDPEIVLPIANDMDGRTLIVGAPRIPACMERLASAIALPPDIPVPGTHLALTAWRTDGAAGSLAAAKPGHGVRTWTRHSMSRCVGEPLSTPCAMAAR
ncbi:hypothetical protein V1460_01380 [Streptomyces sp. SCSIO 30461]|uniref:hypothetical protein n=1 Tax=Streptomyces sp. SCSIO 30461 TaxID=3118085 RepID=UPI0030D2236F